MNVPELLPLKMDPKLVDTMLTHEMDNLSFKDRNDIYEEIHGVVSLDREETPELIQQSLISINIEIDRIKHKYNAYTKATESYNPYAHGVDIRLRFLRCDLFDVHEAAKRMMRYLDLTHELFGDAALQRPIQLRDLGKKEMEMIREGDAQPIPFRDRSGRRVMVAMNNFGLQYPLEVRVCTKQKEFDILKYRQLSFGEFNFLDFSHSPFFRFLFHDDAPFFRYALLYICGGLWVRTKNRNAKVSSA